MGPEEQEGLPERDRLGSAFVGITFLLLVIWFVWSLLSPPGLRVPPELKAEPIPPNFGLPVPLRPPSGRPAPPAYPRVPGAPPSSLTLPPPVPAPGSRP